MTRDTLGEMENETTEHGENIAGDIYPYDAYGREGTLTYSDILHILDAIHTNRLEGGVDNSILSKWMDELFLLHPDIEAI